MERIKAESVSYSYQNKYQTVEAVKDVTCTFETGKMYVITGESGSGKSTFLSLLIFREMPHYIYFIALFFMAIGAVLSSRDEPIFKKRRPAPPSDPET